jgi:hypothetical protein
VIEAVVAAGDDDRIRLGEFDADHNRWSHVDPPATFIVGWREV